MITLIPTRNAEHLAKKLEKTRGIKVVYLDKNHDGKHEFPDGESYVRLSALKKLKGRVVVLHSGMISPNSSLVELQMLLAILRNAKIKPEVFFTYFAYGMQDKSFKDGELNMAEEIFKMLTKYYSVKKIHVLDAHFMGRDWLKKYKFKNVSAVSELIKTAEKKHGKIVYMSPDSGGTRRTNIKGVKKKRSNSYNVEILHDDDFVKAVKGNVVAVVDDLVETGGTLVRFREKCIENGAKHVVALISHGVLRSGIERVAQSYTHLYMTNSIQNKESNVDISKHIALALT